MIDEIRAELVEASSPQDALQSIQRNEKYRSRVQLKPGYRVADVIEALRTMQNGIENGRYIPDTEGPLSETHKTAIQTDLSLFMGDHDLWYNAGLLLARQEPQTREYIEQLNTSQHLKP